ncbi:hemolysin family protein [Ferrimonas balearica]|uniref:hemolysin family protein n=1 Tax=Ferrimonas balearica TaxID=44012 RepID=UPI001C561CA5|nr:hemolysin family protein [Ferrimonas balearica]MBW3163852.1 hemolysin family protein [Ferrimonas balearica]MBY6017031.1 hemolysin family protein [Halomonas denitrificans]MBY6093306.1 hemolysin family protein [Ferrimonas balearica]MBY6105620.1 hemolysin family protein [Ferrimonas balearica]
MNDPLIVTLVTLALIVLSGFFVIIEFALLGARRHRLEEMAIESASARAALRGMNDLTMMLAGAQLGITFCTFALGAVTKPAVDQWLGPVFLAMDLPYWLADGAAFGFALFFVTFLHLVVGEMAPKSWAIAHPERSALAIGIVARAFVWPLRPLLNGINHVANRLVRASGVEPVDSAAVGGRDIDTIRQLVEHSGKVGTLNSDTQRQLSSLIDLGSITVETLVTEGQVMAHVDQDATVADVRAAAMASGHLRILVFGNEGLKPLVVHVRDTLMEPTDRPAQEVARKAFVLDATTPVYEAMARMREASVQLAVVRKEGQMIGIVTLADILKRVLPGSVKS